jgi:hypothetical protein
VDKPQFRFDTICRNYWATLIKNLCGSANTPIVIHKHPQYYSKSITTQCLNQSYCNKISLPNKCNPVSSEFTALVINAGYSLVQDLKSCFGVFGFRIPLSRMNNFKPSASGWNSQGTSYLIQHGLETKRQRTVHKVEYIYHLTFKTRNVTIMTYCINSTISIIT